MYTFDFVSCFFFYLSNLFVKTFSFFLMEASTNSDGLIVFMIMFWVFLCSRKSLCNYKVRKTHDILIEN